MKLTPTEANSALWVKLKEHIEGRLAFHRRRNDGDLDATQTARMRGRIAELLNLLDLDKPEPTHVAEHGDD